MKILSTKTARSIWVVPVTFLNPAGLFLRPAIAAMQERYQFATVPNGPPKDNQPAVFEAGAFLGKQGKHVIVNMTLHNDGIVVDTRSSTDDSDSFLEDCLTWMSREYKLPSHKELPIRKIYLSEIYFSFSKPPTFFNPKFAPFVGSLSKAIGGEKSTPFDITNFQFGPDPTLSSPNPPYFRFEREINTLFSENRYYSAAPIATESHVKLIEKLEEAEMA